ncbi:conserved oligomeric Golgi complex subunit 1 [Patella vulgata]|uniref:conserved oligomeric Golgi complex subunit 1 n=1 Tax=Patella vulgata TaxID=6465 RepID=UPI0024A89D81|nr:conserved oligomeric Golgi complex subunit 1 [Patella vulgata]
MATATRSSGMAIDKDETNNSTLFENFTIDEIREQEKKNRADIERKKEDLRVMVGERYRDLIEAADTITDMKNSAENVMTSISTMETMCQQLKQNHMVKGVSFPQSSKQAPAGRKKEEVEFYGVASQIKLLLDMPEKIWSSVDNQDYLRATQLYLLARHINTSLHLDTQRSSSVLSWFPLLTRQWAAISHFKSSILQGCRNLLKDSDSRFSDQKLAEYLCSILLLEDSTPRQVFNEFLLARTKAVQFILHPNQQSNIKDQVCTVVRVLTNTIHQIYAVFYNTQSSTENCDLLLETINSVTTKSQDDFGLLDLQGSISSRCLPKSVKDFRPALRNVAKNISLQHLQDNCQQWITTCVQDISSGISKLLSYVNTVKRLADIRDAVWQLLQEDENQSNWLKVCDSILDRKLNVWTDVLKPLFLDRVKALNQYQLDTTAELTKRNVTKVMMDLASYNDSGMVHEMDLAGYIWSESAGDISPNAVWTTSGTKSMADSGGLILKARAFTPAVQSLCHSIDEKLKSLQEDNESYLYPEDRHQATIEGPFNLYQDTAVILTYVETSCSQCIQEILNYLTEQLKLWQKALTEIKDPLASVITENKVLLVARLCSAVGELVPHLQKCVLGASEFQTQESFSRSLKKTRSGPKVVESSQWLVITSKLQECKLLSYRIWIDYIKSQIITNFSRPLHSKSWTDTVQTCTRWEEVNIQEETDEGRKLKSSIHIPMQASWYVQSMLYTLCRDINRVGGQALPRSIIQDLVYKVSDGIIEEFEHLVNRGKNKSSQSDVPLTQQQSLQALFNIRFIQLIIPRKDDEESCKKYRKKVESIIERLEDIIDPFDLNVFTPYISSNLLKHTQRCAVIFGAH